MYVLYILILMSINIGITYSSGLLHIKSTQRKRDISKKALKVIGHRLVYKRRESHYESLFSSLGKKEKDRVSNMEVWSRREVLQRS